MKTNLKDLTKGDIIAVKIGYHYSRYVITANNGTHLTYCDIDKTFKYQEVHSYEELSHPKGKRWSHIGEQRNFIIFKINYFYNQ